MWIFPWIKLFWQSCSMWNKPRWLCFWQFLCEGLSSFNSKRLCYSYAWFCSLCEGRSSLSWDLSLEDPLESCLCFQLALFHSVSCFFFHYCSPSSSLCTVFCAVSSKTEGALSINLSAYVFVSGDFNVHHMD